MKIVCPGDILPNFCPCDILSNFCNSCTLEFNQGNPILWDLFKPYQIQIVCPGDILSNFYNSCTVGFNYGNTI